MPLMISRIDQPRGRPMFLGAGRCGSITRHSSSVKSVWHRLVVRLCCSRVVGVHMATPGVVSATPWNHANPSHSTSLSKQPLKRLGFHQRDEFLERIRLKCLAPNQYKGIVVDENDGAEVLLRIER